MPNVMIRLVVADTICVLSQPNLFFVLLSLFRSSEASFVLTFARLINLSVLIFNVFFVKTIIFLCLIYTSILR